MHRRRARTNEVDAPFVLSQLDQGCHALNVGSSDTFSDTCVVQPLAEQLGRHTTSPVLEQTPVHGHPVSIHLHRRDQAQMASQQGHIPVPGGAELVALALHPLPGLGPCRARLLLQLATEDMAQSGFPNAGM